MNNLSKIQIWSPRNNNSFPKLDSLNTQLETLKNYVNEHLKPSETSENTSQMIDIKLLELVELRTGLKSLTDRYESLIPILTDSGNILMGDLTKKLVAIKPQEIRTMRQNIQNMQNDFGTQKFRVDGLQKNIFETTAESVKNTTSISQIKSSLNKIQNKNSLILNSLYTGQLYFINFGEWGILHGLIIITTDIASSYPVCEIDWETSYKGFVFDNRTPIPFKIENKKLYMSIDKFNQNARTFLFNSYVV
jgi:hypothetical protein